MSPLDRYRKQVSGESRRLQLELNRQRASLEARRGMVDELARMRHSYVPTEHEPLSAATVTRRMQFVRDVERTVAAERRVLERLQDSVTELDAAYGRSRRKQDGVDSLIEARGRMAAIEQGRRDQAMQDEIAQSVFVRARHGGSF